MRRAILLTGLAMVAVSFVLGSSAQSQFGAEEDHEDDAVGSDPVGVGYTFTDASGNGANGCFVSSGGMDGTVQALRAQQSGTGLGDHARCIYTLDAPHQTKDLTFFQVCTSCHSSSNNGRMFLDVNGAEGAIAYWKWDSGTTPNQIEKCSGAEEVGCAAVPQTCTVNSAQEWVFLISWNPNEYTLTVKEGTTTCLTHTTSFPSGITALSSISYHGRATYVNGNGYIDQIQFDGGPLDVEEVVVREPAEFDEGLAETVAKLGFISPGSELLFVIIVEGVLFIGCAAATAWFTAGKSKNNTILALPAAFGVLFIFMGYLDLWMYILGLMLGLVAVNKSDVVVNTYYLIMSFRPTRSSTAADDSFEPGDSGGDIVGDNDET